MILNSIRTFIAQCPLLDMYARFNIDYLGVDPTEYTIDSVPTNEVLKEYVDGAAIKQFVFVFGSREYYGADVLQNLENSGFYEQFADWLQEQTHKGNFPILEGNKRPIKIEATTTGYLFDASEDNARYQIQCRLIYYED